MAEKFDLRWDDARPVLHEVLRAGVWVQEDDDAYLETLRRLLEDAPAGGFDVVSDARDYTMQLESSSDDESYDMLAAAGCRRFVQVVTKSSVGMQTARMIRQSAVGTSLVFTACSSMDEAEALVAAG
jgi:hypothetical protein